jgi:hypothetical protein
MFFLVARSSNINYNVSSVMAVVEVEKRLIFGLTKIRFKTVIPLNSTIVINECYCV